MKFSMIKKVLSYLWKCSYVWNVEKNKDILVLDGEISEKIIPCFNGHDFFIIENRSTIYLRYLLEAVFLDMALNIHKILYLYHMRIILKINPKLIITFTDNRPLFWEIDKNIHNKIPFLTVQNGTHYVGLTDSAGEGYSHFFLGGKPFYSNLACISQYDADYYSDNGLPIKKYYTIGSLKLSKYISDHPKNSIKFDLCIIGNSINDRPANIKVWELILEYIKSHDLSVCIALKSRLDYKNRPLIDFFKDTDAIIVSRTEFSSHYLSDSSEVTIGFASTSLRQTFSRGNKIYPLNFASDLFDLPYSLLGATLAPSYSQFESHLNYLLAINEEEYKDQNKELMQYLDIFNPRITPELKLKEIITELLKNHSE